jgi:hypothetical protein
MPLMKALFIVIGLFLISCASSESEVKHTMVIKGINNGNTPADFSIKIYTLYAGPTCGSLTLYRRFGLSGKYFEFFKNNQAVIASARPPEGSYGCIAFEFSPLFNMNCGAGSVDVLGSFPGGTDINGQATVGPDGHPVIAKFLTPATALNTDSPRDFFFVAAGINNCVTMGTANFTFTETNPLP